MNPVTLIFPHQLFKDNPAIHKTRKIYLIEESLFFNQYRFHKQKIAFHRAGMRFYHSYLHGLGVDIHYIESQNPLSDIRKLIPHLAENGADTLHFVETTDYWLGQRVNKTARQENLAIIKYPSPMFLNTREELKPFFEGNIKLKQTDFYIRERKRRKILLDENGKPLGGKWTYDVDNRKKYPRNKRPPKLSFPAINPFYKEAITYTEKHFHDNPGHCGQTFQYPCTFRESEEWLEQFLKERFSEFGPYEDAIVENEHILHHSVLTPMLNTGLLTPWYVMEKALVFCEKNDVPLSSCEGFVRQLIGWREFIRGVYLFRGREERTKNFWNFRNSIPGCFYNGTTGIEPLDMVIKKVLKTGYCHHIERLMILGNFMLLCEFHPDEVYQWFMELFVDAYDWVMVPNVYGMSQFADGGIMATKPYISGSNYILKMSDIKKGSWQDVWDGLFWRFMHKHRDFFLQNPRLGMLVRTFDKMDDQKRKSHLDTAATFLQGLRK